MRNWDLVEWAMAVYFGVCVAGLMACIAALVFLAIWGDPDQQRFMTACVTDRGATKEYECSAMWRSGSSHVTPMPIIIPVR